MRSTFGLPGILIALLFVGSAAAQSLDPAGEEKWSWPLDATGSGWAWIHMGRDTLTSYDYGSETLMEFGRGYGHRIWVGVRYRGAARYTAGSSVTPFDPQFIDSFQILSWRWGWQPKREVFVHLERVCYHLIDKHRSHATWLTRSQIGIGTHSPAEDALPPWRAWKTKKLQVDGFLAGGPYLHGGPQELLGNADYWQWDTSFMVSVTVPVRKRLLVEGWIDWRRLWMSPAAAEPHYDRGEARVGIIVQSENGGWRMFLGWGLHDDFAWNPRPTGGRYGFGYWF